MQLGRTPVYIEPHDSRVPWQTSFRHCLFPDSLELVATLSSSYGVDASFASLMKMHQHPIDDNIDRDLIEGTVCHRICKSRRIPDLHGESPHECGEQIRRWCRSPNFVARVRLLQSRTNDGRPYNQQRFSSAPLVELSQENSFSQVLRVRVREGKVMRCKFGRSASSSEIIQFEISTISTPSAQRVNALGYLCVYSLMLMM